MQNRKHDRRLVRVASIQRARPLGREALQSLATTEPLVRLDHQATDSNPQNPCERLGKNKTPQTVTLQVTIELFFVLGNFGAGGKQEHGQKLCADFVWTFARAKYIHLQCCRLRCFSFAGKDSLRSTVS